MIFWYETRFFADVHRDHCETHHFKLTFLTLEEAQKVDKEIRQIIEEDNYNKICEFFDENFMEYLAGWKYPFVFKYEGIWKITEKKIV